MCWSDQLEEETVLPKPWGLFGNVDKLALTLWKPPVFVNSTVSPKEIVRVAGTKLLLLFATTEWTVDLAEKAKNNIDSIIKYFFMILLYCIFSIWV